MKKKWILPIMLVFALSLTACTSDSVETPEDLVEEPGIEETSEEEAKDEDTDIVEVDNAALYGEIKITPVDAFNLYGEKYPDTKVDKVELEKDFGNYTYKVEGYDNEYEYEIKINPVTGEIIKEDKDMDMDLDQDGDITREDLEKVLGIVDMALADAGEEAELEQWTLEVESGRVELDIDIKGPGFKEIEYRYDMDGNLLEKDQS